MLGLVFCISFLAGSAFVQGINNSEKEYAFPRVIPNHIWLLIVAIAVASYDHWFS
jgi:hypothetical protein